MEDIPAMDFSNVIVKDDTIITIGRGAVLIPPSYPGKLMISKFDFEGNLMNWFNEYGPDTTMAFIPYYGRAFHQKGDKMLIVGGAGGYYANDYGFATIIDKHSSVDWLKVYLPTAESAGYKFIAGIILEDNTFLLGASRQSFDNDFTLSTILIHADSLGNILWERVYDEPEKTYKFSQIVADTDTTFLLGLRIRSEDGGRSTILKINQNGDILKEWQNDNPKTYSPKKIFKTPDGGYVFVSRYLKEIHEDGYPSYQGYICKLDEELNKEWELKIGHRSYTTNFHSMMQTYDGKFIAVGAVNDTFQTVDSWRQYGWLVKFDEDGNVDWEQKIHSGIVGQSVITGIAETAGHDLVACGLSQAISGDYPQQGWLLKLDEYGCLDANWCDTTYVATRPSPKVSDVLQISPNPAHTTIRVSFDDTQNGISKAQNIQQIQVFNLMGQEFIDRAYGGQPFVEVDVADLPSGLYIVVVNGQWVRKVVVE